MKIAILDDYQNATAELDCFELLREHEVKIFNSGTRGLGQLAIRLAPFDALVLIRERTSLSRALLSKLPNLKLISQTGKLAGHVDVAAASELGIAIAEGVGSPTAPAELTWALIMAASRKIVPYANNLKDGLWQTASINPALNGLGTVLRGRTWRSGATARSAASSPATAARSACRCWCGAARPAATRRWPTATWRRRRARPSLNRPTC